MNEERLQVLQMIADGTITPEQGDELLAALGASAATLERQRERVSSGVSGWTNTSARGSTLTRLSEARMHGVTPEYIRGLSELGYGNLPLEQYIELRVAGVTPEF